MIILSSNLLLRCGRCHSPVEAVEVVEVVEVGEVGEVGAVNSPMEQILRNLSLRFSPPVLLLGDPHIGREGSRFDRLRHSPQTVDDAGEPPI